MNKQVEEKWAKVWEDKKCFEANANDNPKKTFVTMPFPYMNGPMHIGHAFTALRVDVYARYKRMQGHNTLFPFAWHWTGQPIVAAAERLSKKDPAMEREFIEIDKVPRDQIEKFFDPEYMARYYTENARGALKKLGLSIDWRREFHTTDLEPTFNRFVLWQMNKLREKGFITLGTHPVVWCPRDQSPTGDHDRLEGEGVTWEEYTVILFPFETALTKAKLAAATLRPETVFAVTNIWINPAAKYVEVEVDGSDIWIVSPEAARKLSEQLKKIKTLREFLGSELVGKAATNPLDNTRIPILPADFVDPDNGTGVVYSVPAHAPFDYVALRDLQKDLSALTKYRLNGEVVSQIKPIALIDVPGFGEFPAVEIVDKMQIQNQMDPKLTEATKEIYRSEFHQGRLNKNAGRFQSKLVSEVKPDIVEELKSKNLASNLYDLPDKVVCRCLTECIVKVLSDQWFLKYSDPEWKRLAHQCIDSSSIFPENSRQWYHDVIDWLRDWPCARRVGLGTPLPWSRGWIVETLSDSTIYTSFYTINSIIKENGVLAESLTANLFDFVLLGLGNAVEVAQDVNLKPDLLNKLRREFLYFYPVNLRNSAKELIPNHLAFYVFQHTAFFPRDLWPTGIAVNGMMMNEGVKMSKSKGNVITLEQAIRDYGSDSLRAALMNGAEGMDDLDWREKTSRDIQKKIDSLPDFVFYLKDKAKKTKSNGSQKQPIDFWLQTQIQKSVQHVSSNLDQMKTKSAFQEAFFNYWNDLRQYLDRTETPDAETLEYSVRVWIKLLAPFIPYTCEELNSALGSSDIISLSNFPEPDEKMIHEESILQEDMIAALAKDAKKIGKILKERPNKLHVYLAPDWAYTLMLSAIESRQKNGKQSDLIREFFESNPSIPKSEVSTMVQRISKNLNELGEDFAQSYFRNYKRVSEYQAYASALKYLGRELEVAIEVHNNEEGMYDPKQKSKFAIPFRPALYFE